MGFEYKVVIYTVTGRVLQDRVFASSKKHAFNIAMKNNNIRIENVEYHSETMM